MFFFVLMEQSLQEDIMIMANVMLVIGVILLPSPLDITIQ